MFGKLSFILFFLLVQNAFSADLNLDPVFLKLKVYKLAVSTSPLCTNLTTVINESSPTYVDILDAPTFGDGQLANGTYPCIAIEFSDNIKYSSNATSTSGNCVSGTEYTLDVCSSGTSKMIDGSTTTCNSSENIVTMYLSTASTKTTAADAFNPPISLSDSTYGFKLASSLVVNGTAVGKFVVNGTDKICDTNDGSCSGGANTCEMAPPLFSFAQQ